MRKAPVQTLVFVLAALLFSVQAVQAGQTSPGLERQMASMAGSDEITVLVVLRDQADIKSLNADLRLTRATMAVRHRTVIGALKDAAQRSQGPILAEMASLKAADTIVGFKSYWLINAITVTTTVDGARQLALRDDVEVVEANMVIQMIEPANFDPKKQLQGGDKRVIGITPGLLAINARRVWEELGIDGTGALVGNMDTGVDSSHPALTDRWRGNFAPASECWFDAIGYGDPVPTDHHFHGTHVMGTICGLAPGDTIGVAPGALWIANNTIDQGANPGFDSDVLNGLQWFSDPDGNPETLEDVPDVVQHSWGVNENFPGYFDCDSRWWDAIDNCEAAGVVNTWSAGNEGPDSGSLRSPADRADSPYNCFSVGSTITSPPYTISEFSSRGPTGCSGTSWPIKPEVSAPGSNIYSAEPGGGYRYLSGTSMAGPHVAGVVALMRAANPDVDVDTIKQILMDTATDLGVAGEDNTYGHGLINAYDAVLAVLDGYGWIEGTLIDRNTGLPIPGAAVNVLGDPRARVTSAEGSFSLALPPGPWTLEFSGFGYLTNSRLVDVIADMTVDGSFQLIQAPTAVVSGTVRDFELALVEGATITVLNTPIEPVLSQADGTYAIAVPDGATYDIRARKDGLGGDTHTVDVAGPTTLDFELPELNSEDFESGDFQIWPWEMSGSGPWTIDSANPYEGAYSAKSGSIGDNQTSTMEMTLTLVQPGEVTFWYSVSSEDTYDFLRFFIDNVELDSWSGNVGWTQATYPISNGTHTFKWSYTKDQLVANGSDAGWVDLIDFPAVGAPTYPQIGVSPGSMAATIMPDQQTEQTLTLDNTGEGVLVYTLSVQETATAFQTTVAREPISPEEQWNRRDLKLAKGEKDPRVGQSPLLGAGGPDDFGYRWTDSDEPGGPIYQWVEINSVGTPLTMDDDTYSTGHAIGFPFTFYGVEYTSVNISTNGFISFTSPSGLYYSNTGIPNPANPNDMVCALWDDLNAADGGTIYKYQDTANNRFIVEWDNVPHYGSGGADRVTMQIILNLDGSIYFQYKTLVDVTECTVGIENMSGTDGLETVFNAAYLHNDLAIRYSDSPPIPWLSLSPVSGVIESMNSGSIAVTYDATGMDIGTYGAIIRVGSNDPDMPIVDVPITLTVQDDASPVLDIPLAFRFDGAAPNPFNPMTTLHFSLPVAGHAELKLFDVQGRLVRTLVDGQLRAGPGQVRWDGRDQGGRRVASGTYYARLVAAGQSSVKPLVLVK